MASSKKTYSRGAALVEFVIAMTLLLLLTFGTIIVGSALRASTLALEASRYGARSAAARVHTLTPMTPITPLIGQSWTTQCQDEISNINYPANVILETAARASCQFMVASLQTSTLWHVDVSTTVISEDGVLQNAISVTVRQDESVFHISIPGIPEIIPRQNTIFPLETA